MKDMPLNTHFRADFLVSFATLREFYDGHYPDGWFWNPCWTYVLLREGVQSVEIQQMLPKFVQNIILPIATSTVLVVVGVFLLKHYRLGVNP